MRARLLILAVAIAAVACGGPRNREAAEAADTQAQATVREFPSVQIPGVISKSDERADYAAKHFWDRFFSEADGYPGDSLTVLGVPAVEVEGAFSTFVTLLESMNPLTGQKAMSMLFSKVEAAQAADSLSNILSLFSTFAEHYLYDPNSPYRNEDLYYPFVKGLAESPLTDPDQAASYAFIAQGCSLNSVGKPASDFSFRDINGKTRRLYDIKAKNILLMFSNPDCDACRKILDRMQAMRFLPDAISSGELAVVNVYIDEDVAAWRKYQVNYPKEWLNGYDPGTTIRRERLYDVRAIPSLYVLDSQKRVILKDAPEETVYSFLESFSGLNTLKTR